MNPDSAFRASRWRRAGASTAQIDALAEAHAALTSDGQAAEGRRVDSVSDSDLAAELDADAGDITAGSKDDVLARVGDDRELAAVALSKEQASARPRKGLIDALTALIEAPPPDD